MKLVAALKMLPTPEQASCLKATLARCNEACDWLAGPRGFSSRTFGQYALHKMGYAEIRDRLRPDGTGRRPLASPRLPMPSRSTARSAPVFRPDAAQPYDDRIIRFVKDGSAVSLWTLEGRMVIPIVMGEHQRRLMAFRKGEVDLCFVRGKWMWPRRAMFPRLTSSRPRIGLASISVSSRLPLTATAQPIPAPTLSASGAISRSADAGLQKCGTKGAKRRLRKLAGKTRRGTRSTPTTCISKAARVGC